MSISEPADWKRWFALSWSAAEEFRYLRFREGQADRWEELRVQPLLLLS